MNTYRVFFRNGTRAVVTSMGVHVMPISDGGNQNKVDPELFFYIGDPEHPETITIVATFFMSAVAGYILVTP